MRRLASFFVLMALSGATSAMYADTIAAGTYNITASAYNNTTLDSLSGTIALNADGYVTGADVTLTDTTLGSLVFTGSNGITTGGPSGYQPSTNYAYITGSGSDWSGQLVLYYVLGQDGGLTLCIDGMTCNAYQKSYLQIYNSPSVFNQYQSSDLISGSIVASGSGTAVTPEPGTLMLLITGVAGFAGLAKKRMARGIA